MGTEIFEIVTLVTGLVFLVLEIRQSNWMWLMQFLSSAAAIVSFVAGGLYASAGLNVYYVVMAAVGLYQWRKDAVAMGSASGSATDSAGKPGNGELHLRRPGLQVWLVSAAVMVAGTAILFFILRLLGDPKSVTDAGVTVLSGIATWWLAKSYPEQWLLWVVADAVSAWMCWSQGMAPLAVLYAVYAVSAIYGYIHWMRKGRYIDTH
ncbi:MAG: nicotinamide riboside transporter PnuC [Candidatus Cryptobacteroides sp.]